MNADGNDILEKFEIRERPAGERARDRLSQALFTEIYRNGRHVLLDLRDLSEADWHVDPFAASIGELLARRYGAQSRPLRVAPATHHTMGGVVVDSNGATGIPGIFAAGEVTGGLHGANRMGGNALSDTLVFGARSGAAAAAWVVGSDVAAGKPLIERLGEAPHRWSKGTLDGAPLKDRLRRIMWEDGGIARNKQGLSRALEIIREMETEAAGAASIPEDKSLVDLIEFRSAAATAVLILEGALRREESRGAHFREDFPLQDDAKWQGHLEVRLTPEGEHSWRFAPEAR